MGEVSNEIKSRGRKGSTLWRKVRNLEGWPASPLLFLLLFLLFLLSTTTLDWLSSLAGKMKNGFLSGRCATFLSSGRINYGTPDRESWGGSWGYLQTCSNENNALWGCSKASRASYNVLNLSLIVIAFCL